MAATNVQAFSGDVEITSNLEVGTANLFVDTVSGNVGIGLTNPSNKLMLKTNWANNSYDGLFIQDNQGTDYVQLGSNSDDASVGSAGFFRISNTGGDTSGGVLFTGNDISYINGGNVGIGTDDPALKLDCYIDTNAYGGLQVRQNDGGFAKLVGNAGDGGHNNIVEAGDLGIVFSPNNSASTVASGKGFYITPWGSGTKGIKILDNGNVGIGATNPAYSFQTSGNSYLTNTYVGGARIVTNRNSGGRILFSGSQDSKWIGRGNNAGDIHFTRSDNNNMLEVYYGGISKAGGTFDIKHPLSKIGRRDRLRHSFIEGPRADNIYRGVVELVSGNATVNMCTDSVESPDCAMRPGTFTALNKNHQFFLQNVSDFDRVKGRLDGETLTIESENPTSNSAVSWMVVGERQDEHMRDLACDMTNDNGSVVTEYIQDEADLPDSDVQGEEEEDEVFLQ
jgi:hypothetical protein